MKKYYLQTIFNENSIMELLSVLKKDSDLYKKSIEEKYGDTYQNVKKKYGIKNYKKVSKKLSLGKKIVHYEYEYPDKDPNSPDRTLSNEWGYFMVFKSMGWRLEERLLKIFSKRNYKKNEKFRVKISGYFVRVNIIKIETN